MKLLKQILLFVSILFVVFYVLDIVFTSVFKNGYYNKTQWINQLENREFDYIIHGNSRAYTTIDVGRLNKETGLHGLNISVDGSSITEQSLMVQMFFAKKNKTKALFLEIDFWTDSVSGTSSINLERVSKFDIPKFFPYLKEDLVFDHYKDFGAAWYVYRYIPFYRYAEYNSIWGPHQIAIDMFHLLKPEYDQNGGHFYTNFDYKGDTTIKRMPFDSKGNFKYLNRIIAECEKNNMKLVCFTSPVANIRVDKEYFDSIETLRQMLASKNVQYHNFAHIFSGQFEKFIDETHINPRGVAAYHDTIQNLVMTYCK